MLRLLAPALLLSLAACGQQETDAAMPPPLEGADIGGPFTLVSETGAETTWSDFDGRWRMVYFGYTFCPDICPYDVQRMAAGYRAFAAEKPELAERVVPIFVSVDPARDTPAVVAEFTDAFSPELVGLTGSEEQVAATADTFKIYYAKGEETAGGGYLMNHSRVAYLFDPAGRPIALLPVEDSAAAVTQELDRWVR